ncbi:hypothetical protein DFH07DRAFT_837986 [Mycena maculata]|uniref:histidine kinase n=1 Tax=Mycena maculata TaxID=230809 RepID=A0AAD7IEQ4_9AGAR|nr:hypothetical protein DFH07DRAFT_837986 [Mycena maculata]
MESAEDDLEALNEWTLFLQEYARGNDERPPPPPLRRSRIPVASNSKSIPAFEVPLYPRGKISSGVARTIAEFYDEWGFLPPPRADEENVRLQTIQEYNLFRQDQLANFHRCSGLVSAFFDFAPICTISLFHNDVQVIVSKAGNFPVELGESLVTETSICGHVVLKKQTTELNEIANDWRFAGNPWCSMDAGVKGYIGVPITLEADPSNPNDSERVTVGVVALMSNKTFPQLTDTQRKVLDDLSAMLSVQLRSTWEGWRRGKETRLRNAVSQFLTKALVDPTQKAMMDAAAAMAEPPVQGAESGRSTPRSADLLMSSAGLFDNAAQQLHELLDADFAIIVDLTAFHASKLQVNGRRQHSHSWLKDGEVDSRSPRRVRGSSSSPAYSNHDRRFATPEAMSAIGAFLDKYAATGRSVFGGSDSLSGLEGLLSLPHSSSPTPPPARGAAPSGAVRATPHLAIPFYSANRPSLLVVVASAATFHSFKPADVTFASNVGVVLVAHLAQNTIVEADAAKTAFVSQISHELRTPLHGLLGHLDLLRDSFSSGDLSPLPSLLDSAEYCGAALRDIVDDVLDFGKMIRSTHDSAEAHPRPPHAPVDIAQITVETSRACWVRHLQRQRHTGSELSTAPGPPPRAPLELAVEYEDRLGLMSLDLSGFIRILNNLLTNSLKYTPQGLVTVSLSSGHGTDKDGDVIPQITLRVKDTGVGIAPAFLDRLFEPFTQADSFSPGAGLGLHICKAIVDRMQGEITVESQLGCGSTFTVVLPVKDAALATPSASAPRRHLIAGKMKAKMKPPPLDQPTKIRSQPTPPPTPENMTEPGDLRSLTDTAKTPKPPDDEHLKILVVDDNAISRKILVAMLKRLNATAHQADDGINALEVFQEVHPNVVWTDVSMPRMDGVTAAKEMRRIERERGWAPSHIVAITGLGLSDEHIRQEALLGPAALDGWLIKGQTNMSSLKESLVAVRQKLRSHSEQCSGS